MLQRSSENKAQLTAKLPSINYVWVGPPSPESDKKTVLGVEKKGHDVEGPIAMAKANGDNPINFWCLRAHVTSYERNFKGLNINVYSIEDYITAMKKSQDHELSNAARAMQEIMDESLRRDKKDNEPHVRFRVTVKDAFNLFLHMSNKSSLYTLDTNVAPTLNTLHLPDDDKFRMPLLAEKEVDEDLKCDCWALFSSMSNKFIPKDAFLKYYAIWKNTAQSMLKEKDITREYQEELGSAIIGSLIAHQNSNHFKWWKTSASESISSYIDEFQKRGKVSLEGLPLQKKYYSTHKVYGTDKIEPAAASKQSRNVLSNAKDDACNTALSLMKNYIEAHQWQLAAPVKLGPFELFSGGKPIDLPNGEKKTVPDAVFRIWKLLFFWEQDRHSSYSRTCPEYIFDKIISLGTKSSRENEAKANATFGARQHDTCDYLNLFNSIKTPEQCIQHFSNTPEIKAQSMLSGMPQVKKNNS